MTLTPTPHAVAPKLDLGIDLVSPVKQALHMALPHIDPLIVLPIVLIPLILYFYWIYRNFVR